MSAILSTVGIWVRDIRYKSNIQLPQLNKILKALEGKKLVKAVKSVNVSFCFYTDIGGIFCPDSANSKFG